MTVSKARATRADSMLAMLTAGALVAVVTAILLSLELLCSPGAAAASGLSGLEDGAAARLEMLAAATRL